jgi:hypothetical protein
MVFKVYTWTLWRPGILCCCCSGLQRARRLNCGRGMAGLSGLLAPSQLWGECLSASGLLTTRAMDIALQLGVRLQSSRYSLLAVATITMPQLLIFWHHKVCRLCPMALSALPWNSDWTEADIVVHLWIASRCLDTWRNPRIGSKAASPGHSTLCSHVPVDLSKWWRQLSMHRMTMVARVFMAVLMNMRLAMMASTMGMLFRIKRHESAS